MDSMEVFNWILTFKGDVYPSDDEDEDDDLRSNVPSTLNDLESESAPLLQRTASSERHPHRPPVQGTSPSKAFFMLVKAFVGTGGKF